MSRFRILSEGSMTLINIGFGNMDKGLLIDASFGRSTKAALIMDSGNVILSALTPEVLAARMSNKNEEGAANG